MPKLENPQHKCRPYPLACLVCGIPVLQGKINRKIHKKCNSKYVCLKSREWYEERRDSILERHNKRSKTYYSKFPCKKLLAAARSRAKTKGWDFNITEKDIVIPILCPILQVELKKGTPYAPSLDRIDPTKGYIKGNVWIISRKANAMKQDASKEELERFAEWVKNYPH